MNIIYCLVFNCVLCVWQVVLELVKGGGGLVGYVLGWQSVVLLFLGFVLMCLLGWVSLVIFVLVQFDVCIIFDFNVLGCEWLMMVMVFNGVLMVNIIMLLVVGVLCNCYLQFDVGCDGVMFNNVRGQVQMQLGGWVQGNLWFVIGSVRVIFNEVNGLVSWFNGYVEVVGQCVEVIIVNLVGIQVNGGGFFNVSWVILIIGMLMFMGVGVLEGYCVIGGVIQIDGDGLDISCVDYIDLIICLLQVNVGIWVNQLQVMLGNNVVSVDYSQVSVIVVSGEVLIFVLDVGVLGGMFVNKIWLVGNEYGVGVCNVGSIGVQVGELVVMVDGCLESIGVLQLWQNVCVQVSGDFVNGGIIVVMCEVVIIVGGMLDNSGGMFNVQCLQVEVQGLCNYGGVIEQIGV